MQLAIVEDHLLLAESLGNSLANALENCSIKLFDSAESFLAHHFNDWMPDVVLVDIMLKSMGGIEMIEKIMTTMPRGKTMQVYFGIVHHGHLHGKKTAYEKVQKATLPKMHR